MVMLRVFSIFFLVLISSISSFKFLCYSPRFASSHVNYLGKLSDTLVDAGHEVILLSPILDTHVRNAGSNKARIIEIPQSEVGRAFEEGMNGNLMDKSWQSGETWEVLESWDAMFDLWSAQCNVTINYPGLLEKLRDEKIDVGFGESMDWCMAAIMGGSFTDEMNFFQRAFNFFNMFMYQKFNFMSTDRYQKVFDDSFPGFPNVIDLMADSSFFFLNSDPLVDFPRPSAARIIDLGGIAVVNGHNQLDKKWSAIFDLRPKTVLMSYGTFAKAWAMPEEFKNTIRNTARSFPHVTFIWKYEKPEHNVTQGIPNLLESTWVPQHDMLHDSRLSAFVTHCGQGSTTEANYAGVPLIVVPVIFDQIRNAFQVKRNGNGINLDKTDLGREKVFQGAIREILENPKYKEKAMKIASMLNDKPFTARQTFVMNMEFLAKHGPLRQLDHYGRHLNVMLSEVIDSTLGGPGTKLARVIEVNSKALEVEDYMTSEASSDFWNDVPLYTSMKGWSDTQMFYGEQCRDHILQPALLERLKKEKFDAAFVESFHFCAPVLFHLLGIDKFAVTESVALLDGWFYYSQTPSNPSYVPTMMSAIAGEKMKFFERVYNTYVYALCSYFFNENARLFQEQIHEKLPHLPPVRELMASNSLVFVNSEPLVDFPRPSSARIIDIGGIVVSSKHEPLNKTWSDILDLRSQTVFLSFGTFAKAHLMPEQYKKTIVQVVKKFPNVTFIWKYEKPEHKVSAGVANLIESTWVPQRDLLHDSRLSAFITHCGQGSTTESMDAGIPLVVIPVLGDQYRNAHQVIFVRNMEFLAKHGPLRQLDHYGRHLNFIQYYLIDVIGVVTVIKPSSEQSNLRFADQLEEKLTI
ncbi:hypothetical protein PRIPAC_76671 [Pristionchus pacificus]|uniref:glucuronosyltransferase n=1 Tax=Pristionchus pacificus TaxID=54126 RepID=A0A2A6BWT9_PRIPA|nr:hypothetical protein PRIPAC_76671 [Pristionchus pacificus]|eukprot:PDM70233.1 Glycosyltransferase [Pristionchus pacificus]